MVHGVGAEVDQGRAFGEGVAAHASGVVGEFEPEDAGEAVGAEGGEHGFQVALGVVEDGEEFVGRAVFDVGPDGAWGAGHGVEHGADGPLGDAVGPPAHDADDVGERVVEGLEAEVEGLVKLLA